MSGVCNLSEAFSSRKTGTDRVIFLLLLLFLVSTAFSIFLLQVGYFSALLIWVWTMIRRKKSLFPGTDFDRFFLLYATAELLSSIFAHNPSQSFLYMQRRLLLIPIVYILAYHGGDRRILRCLFAALILSAVGVALWSLRDLFLHLPEYLRFQRRLSEFQIYMTAGGIMMVATLLVFPFTLHPATPPSVRWLSLALLVPLLLNLLFTFTRSSWLGFMAGIAVMAVRRHRKVALPVLALLLGVVMISTPDMRDRMLSMFDPYHPTNVSRLHMWKVGWKMFLDHPVLGIGDIGTEQLWDRYADAGWTPEGHLHNNLVMWLATLGLAGFTALVALFARIWLTIASVERRVHNDWFLGSLVLGAMAVFVGFHVNGLFEWNFGDAEIIVLLWATVGLTLAAQRVSEAPLVP